MRTTYLYLLFLSLFTTGCTSSTRQTDKERLYVSILPLRSLVEQIVGDDFKVDVLVPAGASPESFEPTPRQYVALNRSKLVFNVGLIDFEQNLKQMAANAYDALRPSFPDSVRYTENYEKLLVRLDSLDTACAEALRQANVHTIVIYHPALTYYAADYGLEQLAVEHDGKEPSARHLARLIEEARRKKVRRVFYQAQYPASTVKVIAEDIGARSVKIDPLREDVIGNIGEITRQLTSGNE